MHPLLCAARCGLALGRASGDPARLNERALRIQGTAALNPPSHGTDCAPRCATLCCRRWMKSPGHRANILGAGYRHAGFGLATSDKPYWTQARAHVQAGAGQGLACGEWRMAVDCGCMRCWRGVHLARRPTGPQPLTSLAGVWLLQQRGVLRLSQRLAANPAGGPETHRGGQPLGVRCCRAPLNPSEWRLGIFCPGPIAVCLCTLR